MTRGVHAFAVGSLRQIPLALLPRAQLAHWRRLAPPTPIRRASSRCPARPRSVLDSCSHAQGALFLEELAPGQSLAARCHLEDGAGGNWSRLGTDHRRWLSRDSGGGQRGSAVPDGLMGRPQGQHAQSAGPGRALVAPAADDASGCCAGTISQPAPGRTLWNRWPGRCCAATAWCSRPCWRRESPSCRPGASCSMCCGGWKPRARLLGGRFIEGVSGEQFALPEAIDRLRERAPSAGNQDSAR